MKDNFKNRIPTNLNKTNNLPIPCRNKCQLKTLKIKDRMESPKDSISIMLLKNVQKIPNARNSNYTRKLIGRK